MTFRKLPEQLDESMQVDSPGRPAVSAPLAGELSLAEEHQSLAESEQHEMMLASLEDFEVNEIFVRTLMEDFRFEQE